MRILHISTSIQGGAGQAAFRLYSSQILENQDSHFLCRESYWNQKGKSKKKYFTFNRFTLSKANTLFMHLISKPSYGLLSSISISTLQRRALISLNPDIIHIHNWFNFLSFRDINWLLGKFNCVFTLHDERILTGGCHYTLGCNLWQSNCEVCPQSRGLTKLPRLSKKFLQDSFVGIGNFAVISPSKWLCERAQKSAILKRASSIVHISNQMNPLFLKNEFRPTRKQGQIMFVASDLNNPKKGLSDLAAALNKIASTHTALTLSLVGAGEFRSNLNSSIQINHLGELTPVKLRSEMLSSDILVVPSTADNAPSVVIEGQLSGLVVIGREAGGIPDLIENGKTGYIYGDSVEELANCIVLALEKSDKERFRKALVDEVQSKYSQKNVLRQVNQVYESLSQNS
jgi:glycosyltransferase involved in cell wall biosynthesis